MFNWLQLSVKGIYHKLQEMALCSRCGREERIPGQQWGSECFREYHREHRRIGLKRARIKAKEEAKREIAAMFQSRGLEKINCVTAAEMVRSVRVDNCDQ